MSASAPNMQMTLVLPHCDGGRERGRDRAEGLAGSVCSVEVGRERERESKGGSTPPPDNAAAAAVVIQMIAQIRSVSLGPSARRHQLPKTAQSPVGRKMEAKNPDPTEDGLSLPSMLHTHTRPRRTGLGTNTHTHDGLLRKRLEREREEAIVVAFGVKSPPCEKTGKLGIETRAAHSGTD